MLRRQPHETQGASLSYWARGLALRILTSRWVWPAYRWELARIGVTRNAQRSERSLARRTQETRARLSTRAARRTAVAWDVTLGRALNMSGLRVEATVDSYGAAHYCVLPVRLGSDTQPTPQTRREVADVSRLARYGRASVRYRAERPLQRFTQDAPKRDPWAPICLPARVVALDARLDARLDTAPYHLTAAAHALWRVETSPCRHVYPVPAPVPTPAPADVSADDDGPRTLILVPVLTPTAITNETTPETHPETTAEPLEGATTTEPTTTEPAEPLEGATTTC